LCHGITIAPRTARRTRETPWSALVRRLHPLPAGALVGGILFAFPVVILLYWLTNNAWVAIRQVLLHRHMDGR
jgi:YidC/Oxa1 family membrane protein insertase